MKKIFRKLRRSSKAGRIIFSIIGLAYIVSFVFFAKSIISLSGIETLIRYIVLVLFLAYFIFYIYKCVFKLIQKKYVLFVILNIISFIFVVIFSIGAFSIDWLLGQLGEFGESDTITYTSYLITLNDTTLNTRSTLGMIDDVEDIEGNIIAKKILDEYELSYDVEMYEKDGTSDPYLKMLYDLYEKKIDGIFISSNYVTLYSGEDDFVNIAEETKVVYQLSKKYKNVDKNIAASDKKLTEPFTVLVMGVDSEFDGLDANAAFNGDTLILATFNPNTLNATMFSLPRDIYVPIACRRNAEAKINSSAASGTQCVIDTIENLTDIEIDYYAKINFKGVVQLVDAVGGIDVDVEEPDYYYNHGFECFNKVCEQDSNRRWGEYTIYIEPGPNKHLNGEEALAYARCRGLYAESDLARNRHQQDIILSIAQKLVHVKNLKEFKKILNSVSNNVSTNMDTDQILSSYKVLKNMVKNVINDKDFLSVQKTKLQVYSLPVYLPNGNYTSALGYYQNSLDDIVKEMRINLELEDPEIVTTMKYSLNEPYEQRVAGAGITGGGSNSTLSDFENKTRGEAEKYCHSNDIECSFTFIDETSEYYDSSIETDKIAYQSVHAGTLLKNVNSIRFYIIGATSKKEDKKDNNTSKTEDDNQVEEEKTDTPEVEPEEKEEVQEDKKED